MADRLQRYRERRDPSRTPEPFAAPTAARAGATAGRFVVQQHAARRLHWDFRLEIDGVLASWAVPRGPAVDPQVKRLAVRTEDHPLEYADFEGCIPAGNYGAGAVIVWDTGVYHTADGAAAAPALSGGHIEVVLAGCKLHGRWLLVRTRAHEGKDWLLFHKADGAPAGAEPVALEPASVLSGLTVEEVRAGTSRTAELAVQAGAAGAPRRSLPAGAPAPMLAAVAARPFSKAGWLFELKYDGVRVAAWRRAAGPVRLSYRSGGDATVSFPELARAAARLPCDDFVIDGEICALDARGASSFGLLQQRLGVEDPTAVGRLAVEVPAVLYCFDLSGVAGHDLRGVPLRTRKRLLERLVPRRGVLRYAEHFEEHGSELFAAARDLGLEGILAKRADSPYRSGKRSGDWLKIKVEHHADLAVVGFVRGKGARTSLGAMMLAWRAPDALVYAGNVGTGFAADTLTALRQRLEGARRATPAFRGAPPGPARANVFVEPALVAEVRYGEVTAAGVLRHPVFVRLRADKTVAECDPLPPAVGATVAPSPPPAAAAAVPAPPPPPLRLSNLDKVFWPEDGYTKGDLLHYYEQIWPALAPYLRDRPVVLTRFPDGIAGKSFFQKNAPEFTPPWVETCHIEGTDYFLCNELQTLLYVINSGCIPLHVWSARRGSLERPDWAILDLDPKGAPFPHVVRIARHLHAVLDAIGVANFVKTSGQDGLHVLVPLGARLSHAEARLFAEVLARVAVAEQPALATIARPLGARDGKVYVDYLQNGWGKTIAAPFSVRPRPRAPVSMPLAWSGLRARLDPAQFTMRTAPARWHRLGDPLLPVLEGTADVAAALQALQRYLGSARSV